MKLITSIFLSSTLAIASGIKVIAKSNTATFEEVKAVGAQHSKYKHQLAAPEISGPPEPDLATFQSEIGPILEATCYSCHGEKKQKADFRMDTLDPDLTRGEDVNWWLEVVDVLSNGEMPPQEDEDEEEGEKESVRPEMADEDRGKVIDWLSSEIQLASQIRRSEGGHSSFRRMTAYEYNYALQDLLGLPLQFSNDLPPEPASEDGFKNSSEMLKISPKQYKTYLDLNRGALNRATVRGDRPNMLYWGVSAKDAVLRKVKTPAQLDKEIKKNAEVAAKEKAELALKADAKQEEKIQKEDVVKNAVEKAPAKDEVAKEKVAVAKAPARGRRGRKGGPFYLNTLTGDKSPANWSFRRAVNAWPPSKIRPPVPEPSNYIAMLPAGQKIVVELGNKVPDEGIMRVRVRASKVSSEPNLIPSLALEFGWQGSNNSKGSVKISDHDLIIDAPPGKPTFYQWDIHLSDVYPRNPVRKTVELGAPKMTNPSEYIRLHNTSYAKGADIQFDYVEVSSPVYEQWPPVSHTKVFIASDNIENEKEYAREIISQFMKRAWRRNVTDSQIDTKVKFFERIRPVSEDFQQAVIEVLATILSSPRFLYLVQSAPSPKDGEVTVDEFELATRLSMFLWLSVPDEELLNLAAKGQLSETDELIRQTKRMLADPRHERFSEHFVRQWLDMELLDFLNINKSEYPEFSDSLQEAMKQEPVAFFEEVLHNNHSVMDFIHADYAMVNQQLAQHYGLSGINGPDFQKVFLKPDDIRGGLLTQAGLLAMNSDGSDSNPLKRGIWLLESILNDPPPPPPPAVPEIDLTDPEILKLTLKERMEDHRDDPACRSCHSKIDPWGIAMENFDASGSWRDEINGAAVDASSLLFNKQKLDGIGGLKRFLLSNRQDQFTSAMVHKMATFALGRPLSFADRSSLESITSELRNNGDGLETLVTLLVTSEIFKSK